MACLISAALLLATLPQPEPILARAQRSVTLPPRGDGRSTPAGTTPPGRFRALAPGAADRSPGREDRRSPACVCAWPLEFQPPAGRSPLLPEWVTQPPSQHKLNNPPGPRGRTRVERRRSKYTIDCDRPARALPVAGVRVGLSRLGSAAAEKRRRWYAATHQRGFRTGRCRSCSLSSPGWCAPRQ